MADQVKYTNKLKNTKVLVIGGSSGIGYGVAEALVEHGATVTISSSNVSRLEGAIAKLKENYPSASSRILGYACDLGDENGAEENIKTLFEKTGKLDHVVFTAGDALAMIPMQDITMEKMRKAGQIRFFAPLLVAKHAPHYLTGGPKSSISLTAGVIADRPIPGWTIIAGFASGLQGVTRGLAMDLAPVRVNVIQPGMVDTNLYATSGIGEEMKKGIFEQTKQKLPTGKVGTVEDLAEAYLYLMRDENVTGAIVNSSGGQLLV